MLGLLPLTFTLALDPAATASPQAMPQIAAGNYAYKASIGGQAVGQSTIVVKRDGTTTEIDENSSGTFNGTPGAAKAILSLGADLSPTTYTNNYNAGGMSGSVNASFTGTTATLTGGLAGSKSFTLAGDAKHFVVLDGAELAGFVALPAQMQAWNNVPALAVFPLYGQTIALAPKPAIPTARPTTVSPTDVGVSVEGPAPFTLWYDPATLVMDELDVPSQKFIVTRAKS